MKISYYGHSCFTIESKGFIAVLDPYRDVEGRKDISLCADAVYCSHEHFDHNFTEGVSIDEGKENPFRITEIHTFHDSEKGALRGSNIIRIFEAEGYRAAHFGDLGCRLEESQIKLLQNLDIAMIPVGGTYTIDSAEAKELIEAIKPAAVLPMHYRNGEEGFSNIGTLKDFTNPFDKISVVSGPLELERRPKGIICFETPL